MDPKQVKWKGLDWIHMAEVGTSPLSTCAPDGHL